MNKIACTLLVDDDNTANYLNQLLFERLEATEKLLVAHNGQEALTLLTENCPGKGCPTLILLDINMPIMDGFEFLEAYEQLNFKEKQNIIIVVLTTSLNPMDVQKVEQAKIAGLINKPLSKKALQEIIEQHFN
ncbi:response regulator [Adhaeribacter swui]|uniref:Response regulator n=1 Tax=Adhaeribacter swui TaxID=2086471 RepID=A0A7G7GAP8_9BACT|nr:response regulator [Adhaeribacter swui]QNF34232.1 response regulator [Adhaeribacter swui]